MKVIAVVIVAAFLGTRVDSIKQYNDEDNECKEEGRFALTECDREHGRWRVQVPSSARCSETTSLWPARRVEQCHISCDPGYYYNLEDLSCRMCRPGTYSLGGGILLDSFDTNLPEGMTAEVESYRFSLSALRRGGAASDLNCNTYGWAVRGGYLASLGGPCAAVLSYTVHLVKPGNLTYTYQFSDRDVIFNFEVLNGQCQTLGETTESRLPLYTREGEWKKQTIRLVTGQNVLQWKTFGMDHSQSRPVLIKSIEISGVSLTSPCVPCRAGTFSGSGSRSCSECPENTYSSRGSATCTPCNVTSEYAPKGAPACIRRLKCTRNDYYETRTPCDVNKKTQQVYKWLKPQVCRDDLPGAAQLPPPSRPRTCSQCNPGMHYGNESTCQLCPHNTWGDGSRPCRACPPGTMPDYGLFISRWVELPSFMSAGCLEPDVSVCPDNAGWQAAGDHVHSGHNQAPGAYLLLSLPVSGFRSKGGVSNGRRMEVGRISFSFELECPGKCELAFMQASPSRGVSMIQSWTESRSSRGRMEYSHPVLQNDSYTFSWAFQSSGSPRGGLGSHADDIAKIYFINVTNTIDGGAASCVPCLHQDTEEQGCIPCPPGQYMDPNTTNCEFCPVDTTAVEPLLAARLGQDGCQPCGPGLHAYHGGNCETTCTFLIDGLTYDFRSLQTPVAVRGSRLFTASGTQYYHVFNISLCGAIPAECSNSISDIGERLPQQVESFICRVTISDTEQTLSTQSVTLGDELLAVTSNKSFMNMKVIDEFANSDFRDIHFYYATPMATHSCPLGRSTILTLRCDPEESGNSTIKLPSQWPDGTSDGCNFNLLWISRVACPVCTSEDYKVVKEECINRQQVIHYLPAKYCYSLPNDTKSETVPCTTHIPLEVQIGMAASGALALLLCAFMVYFWKKTQSLEYKYMKLVQSSGGRDGEAGDNEVDTELAPAESCALGEGEEEDIAFSQPSSQGRKWKSVRDSSSDKISTKNNPIKTTRKMFKISII